MPITNIKASGGTFVPIPNITYKFINPNIIIFMFIFLISISSIGSITDKILPTELADKNHPTEPVLLSK